MVLKRFLAFLVMVIVLNGLVYGIMYFTYYQKYRLFPKEIEYRGLLLADSHGLCLREELEENGIFNFSAESDNYHDMRIKLRYFIRKHPEIKFVLLSVDDHTLSKYREELNNRDRNIIYRDFSGSIEREGMQGGLTFVKDFIRYYLVVLNSKAADISKRYLAGKIRPAKEVTRVPDWSDENQKKQQADARFKSQFPGRKKSAILKNELLAILNDCKKAGIQVKGIRFPLTSIYSDLIKGNGYGADRILQQNGFQLLEFENSIPDEAGNFENQDHLSISGGRKLAALIQKNAIN